MNVLHPEFFWLAPLVAAPIIIHLLNRIRYRRVKWAAIDFLLSSERRAVRRAKLRQIVLLILRTLLLAAALTALLQPIFRGGAASLLGGSSQVAVAIDASASMSGVDASGMAFTRAVTAASDTLKSLPRGTRAIAGTFSRHFDTSTFREPIQDLGAISAIVNSAEPTHGSADVPSAIMAAAEALERGGGGGTIWLVTDMQSDGWRAGDSGAWEQVRQALKGADNPRILVSDMGPLVEKNLAIEKVQLSPAVLIEGDSPKLTVTVALHGAGAVNSRLTLAFDGETIDSQMVQLSEPGRTEVVFRLPPLTGGVHTGKLTLTPDAFPLDDNYYFLLRPTRDIPLLMVDGSPSTIPFEGATDFLSLAVSPPRQISGGRSPFQTQVITPDKISQTPLDGCAAIFLTDVQKLDPKSIEALRKFASAGGLIMVFPGKHTAVTDWNRSGFPGVTIKTLAEADEKTPIKIGWTDPNDPITATLPAEGLDGLDIRKLYRFQTDPTWEVLASTDGNDPFLIRKQIGKGKLYVFAVSAQEDFSNLPFTPVLLVGIHRALMGHLVEATEPPARDTFTEFEVRLTTSGQQILSPDGRLLPIVRSEENTVIGRFGDTGISGFYRLVEEGNAPDAMDNAVPVAALNIPSRESVLEKIDSARVRELLDGLSVTFLRTSGNRENLNPDSDRRHSAASFPFAVLAIVFLVAEVLMAWSMGRAASAGNDTDSAVGPQSLKY